MKKIRLKIVSMLVCFAVFTASAPFAAAYEKYSEENELSKMEEAALAQEDAIRAYYRIYDYIIYDTKNTVSSYHEEYAGCYIDDDNTLVVCVKNGSTDLVDELKKVIGNDPIVRFVYRDWTVAEAISALDEFKASLSENERDRICGMGYSSRKNSVVMTVSAPENIAVHSQSSSKLCSGSVSGYPIIIDVLEPKSSTQNAITESYDYNASADIASTLASTAIYGGDKIYKKDNSIYSFFGTIGVCGTYQRERCILTAGHLVRNWDTYAYYDIYLSTNESSKLGEVVLDERGIGDYAAVKIPTGYSLSNTIFESNNSKKTIYYYDCNDEVELEGRKVFKYGRESGVTSGNVQYSSWTDSHNIHNLVSVGTVKDLAKPGDSGGPVWCVTSKYGYVLLGVLHGDGYYEQNYNLGFSYTPIYLPVEQGFNPWALSPVIIDQDTI